MDFFVVTTALRNSCRQPASLWHDMSNDMRSEKKRKWGAHKPSALPLTGRWPHLSSAAYHATGPDKNGGADEASYEIADPSTKADAEQSKQPTGYGSTDE
jgi:hypothetical protein